MVKALRKLTMGIMATTLLVTGMMVAPVGPGGSSFLSPQKAEAACTKYYTVIWDYAGVYSSPWGLLVDTKRSGQSVTGPSGTTPPVGWSTIYYNGYNFYMKRDSLNYRGCW